MDYDHELFGSLIEKGVTVFQEGEYGDSMYIIQSGCVEVIQKGRGGEKTLALLEKNDFFGEMALIDSLPRSCTIKAVAQTRLLPVTKASLLQRLKRDPHFLLFLLSVVSHRLENANQCFQNRSSGQLSEIMTGPAKIPLQSKNDWQTEQYQPQTVEDWLLLSVSVGNSQQDFEPGDVICSQGETGQRMYVLVQGEVEVFRHEPTGRFLLAVLGPYEIFGEMSLLSEGPRTASVIARTPTRVLSLEKESFLKTIEVHPHFGLYVLQTLILRLRSSSGSAFGKDVASRALSTPMAPKRGKLNVAFVSLSTCGGCTASLLDEPAQLSSLLNMADIDYCPMLMDREHIPVVDVVFVDGAVRVQEDEEILKEARNKSQFLAAWGTCATYGGFPALANQYELEHLVKTSFNSNLDPLSYYLCPGSDKTHPTRLQVSEHPNLLRKAGALGAVVRVDGYIPGCPPQSWMLNEYLHKILGQETDTTIPKTVCAECGRKVLKSSADTFWITPHQARDHSACLVSQGTMCLGFLTRGGCGAKCTKGGLPCWGCRGPSDAVLKKLSLGHTLDEVFLTLVAKRTKLDAEIILPLMSLIRKTSNTMLSFYQDDVSCRGNIL